MLVSIDRIPASTDADATAIQSTAPSTAAVPMVAIAVCATVFSARIPLAANHFYVNTFFMCFYLRD